MSISLQLWPETHHPAYHMFYPNAATLGHSSSAGVHPSPALHPSGAAPLRARSTTPTGGGGGHGEVVGLPGGGYNGTTRYNDLQGCAKMLNLG